MTCLRVTPDGAVVHHVRVIRNLVRLLIRLARHRPRAPYGRSNDGSSARETDQLLTETGFGTRSAAPELRIATEPEVTELRARRQIQYPSA